MRILLLAPHPFFQERGTPIAVDMLLRALSERGDVIDVLTYHEGENRTYRNVTLLRIHPWFPILGVRPGFSLRKLACDWFFFGSYLRLVRRHHYDVVHAVEESAFMAMMTRPFTRVPYVYDLDSLLSEQMIDRYPFLRPIGGVLRWLELFPVRHALATVAVCDAIAEQTRKVRTDGVFVLKDVSLLPDAPLPPAADGGIRKELGIAGPLVMYIGNLQPYQGIDLLLASVRAATDGAGSAPFSLVVIGGSPGRVAHYQHEAYRLEIDRAVHFLGARPVADLPRFLPQADVLVSPRTQGTNTPLKIYSYLDSGVPVVATRRSTHTQVMTDDTAILVDPTPDAFARGILHAIRDADGSRTRAANARAYMRREHSYDAFRRSVGVVYDYLGERVGRR